MKRITPFLVAALLGAAALVGPSAGPAAAATTSTVTTTNDLISAGDFATSFREAITAISLDGQPSTINLAAGATYQLDNCTASGGELHYQSNEALTINGNGAVIEQTCAGERVMNLSTPDAAIVLNDVTIRGGASTSAGAGIWANAPLTINGSRFEDNHQSVNDAGGGALRSMQAVLIDDTVFTGNSAYTGGAISSQGNLTISDSAVVANTGQLSGGIYQGGGSTTLTNSTVADNTATGHIAGGLAVTNLVVRHSTIARNQGTGASATQAYIIGNLTANRSAFTDGGAFTRDCTVGGSTISQGFNLDGDGTCEFGAAGGDQSNAGPTQVAAAADNGGGTLTALPAETSPLVDAIPAANCDGTLPVDQRAVTRPQGDGCDIGAAEVVPVPVFCAGQVVTVDLADGDVPTAGPDVIRGTAGDDTVNALGGDDRFCGLAGVDTFTGGPGVDRAFGGQGADVLRGSAGDDVLDGAGGNDRLYGQIGRDTLKGATGLDTLEGGTGNDVLNGGPQRDTCKGQAGSDTGTACEVRISLP